MIPDSIKYIGDKAFSHCEKLKELKLPGTLETIGKEAFPACRKIKAFDLPDSVKEIDAYLEDRLRVFIYYSDLISSFNCNAINENAMELLNALKKA